MEARARRYNARTLYPFGIFEGAAEARKASLLTGVQRNLRFNQRRKKGRCTCTVWRDLRHPRQARSKGVGRSKGLSGCLVESSGETSERTEGVFRVSTNNIHRTSHVPCAWRSSRRQPQDEGESVKAHARDNKSAQQQQQALTASKRYRARLFQRKKKSEKSSTFGPLPSTVAGLRAVSAYSPPGGRTTPPPASIPACCGQKKHARPESLNCCVSRSGSRKFGTDGDLFRLILVSRARQRSKAHHHVQRAPRSKPGQEGHVLTLLLVIERPRRSLTSTCQVLSPQPGETDGTWYVLFPEKKCSCFF